MTVHFVREFRLTTPDPSAPSSPPPPPGAPPHPQVHVGYLLRAEDASWTSRFATGTRVDLLGSLTLHLMFKDLGGGSAGLRIESLEFDAKAFEESVARGAMEPVLAAARREVKQEQRAGAESSEEQDQQQPRQQVPAPRGRKGSAAATAAQRGMVTRRRSASAKTEQDTDEREGGDDSAAGGSGAGGAGRTGDDTVAKTEQQQQEGDAQQPLDDGGNQGSVVRVPGSAVGGFGITELGMRCLEVCGFALRRVKKFLVADKTDAACRCDLPT